MMGLSTEGMGSHDSNKWEMHGSGNQSYEKAPSSTIAKSQEVSKQGMNYRPGQNNPGQKALNKLRREKQLVHQKKLHRRDQNAQIQRNKWHRKRQNDVRQQNQNSEEESEQNLTGKSSNHSFPSHYIRNNACTQHNEESSHGALTDTNENAVREHGKKSDICKSTSGTEISVRWFKKCLQAMKISKLTRKKPSKTKPSKLSSTPVVSSKRRFCLLSKKDKNSLRVKLSIWFPCLFPRPTLKDLQEALIRMKSSVLHDLCRFEIMDLNQQISEAMAQRGLFRKELLHERSSRNKPIYFASDVVPECQKRVSSFTFDFNRVASFASREDVSKIPDSVLTLGCKLDTSSKIEKRTIIDIERPSGPSLMCPRRKKHETDVHVNFVRNVGDSKKSKTLNAVETEHYHVPEWFRSMLRNEVVIDLYPVCPTEQTRTSFETKQLIGYRRRLHLSYFPHSEEFTSVNGHLFISIREQEVKRTDVNNPVSLYDQTTSSKLSVSHQGDNSGGDKPAKRIAPEIPMSLNEEESHSNSKESSCVHESPSQQNIGASVAFSNMERNRSLKYSQKSTVPDYSSDSYVNFAVTTRNKEMSPIRKQTRSSSEDNLLPILKNDVLNDRAHDEAVSQKLCCPKESSFSTTRIDKTCLFVNGSNVKDPSDETADKKGGYILPRQLPAMKPVVKAPKKQIKHKRLSSPGDIPHEMMPHGANKLLGVSLSGQTTNNVDTNLNKNVNLQPAGLCNTQKLSSRELWQATETSKNAESYLLSEKIKHTSEPRIRLLRKDPTRAINEANMRNAKLETKNVPVYESNGAAKEHILYCETPKYGVNSSILPKQKNKKPKQVRFDERRTCHKGTLDIMNKSNSSVHGIGLLECPQNNVVVDDITEMQELCMATSIASKIYQPLLITLDETAETSAAGEVKGTVRESTDTFASGDKPHFECSHGEKGDSSGRFHFDTECCSDKQSALLESRIWETRHKKDVRLSESEPLLDAIQDSNVKCYKKNCAQECMTPVFGCIEHGNSSCAKASTVVPTATNHVRKVNERSSIASRTRTIGLSPRLSLINFVKEQWRSSCLTSPACCKMSYVSPADKLDTKRSFYAQSMSPKDSDPTSCRIPKQICSNLCPDRKLSFSEQEVEGENEKVYQPVHKEQSYETMCAERRQNYQKLCRTLEKYYQSISPERVHDVDNICSLPSRQLRDDASLEFQSEIKISGRSGNRLDLLFKPRDIAQRSSQAPAIIKEQTPVTGTKQSYLHSKLVSKWESPLEQSTVNTMNKSSIQNSYSYNSTEKRRPEIRQSSSLFAIPECQTSASYTRVRQTQTSPTAAYTPKVDVITDSISSMLDLTHKETEWLMDNIKSWFLTDPSKLNQLLCIIFALDKLLARYFRTGGARRQRQVSFDRRSSSESTEESRTARKQTCELLDLKKTFQNKQHEISPTSVNFLSGIAGKCINPGATREEKSWREIACYAAGQELAQNCSVNNGQDSPSTFSQSRSPNDKDLKGPQLREPLDKGGIEIIQTVSGKEVQSVEPFRQERRVTFSRKIPESAKWNIFKSRNTNISNSPAGNVPASTSGNISKTPAENGSKSPSDSLNHSIKNTPENVSPTRHSIEPSISKEITDALSKIPSHLSQTSQHSIKPPSPTDTLTSHVYTKAPTSGQASQDYLKRETGSSVLPDQFFHPRENNHTSAYNSDTINRPTFRYNDSIRSKRNIESHTSHKLQSIQENSSMSYASPYLATTPEILDSERVNGSSKNQDSEKNFRSILSSPTSQKYNSTATDFMELLNAQTVSQKPTERPEFVKKAGFSPTLKSQPEDPDLYISQTTANYHSADRPYTSPSRTPALSAQQEHTKRQSRQDKDPCQLSPAQIWFRDICNRVNTSSKASGLPSQQQNVWHAGSRCDSTTRLNTRISVTSPRDTADGSQQNRYKIPKARDSSNSPHDSRVNRFTTLEVDNRLLDPSKKFNDVALLEDSCQYDIKMRRRSAAFQEYMSSKLNQLKATTEEKSDPSSGEFLKNQQPTRLIQQAYSPGMGTNSPDIEISLEQPYQVTPCSKRHSPQNCVHVCIQTCACISKPNGTCLCGYVSKNKKCGPSETNSSSSSKGVTNGRYGMNGKSDLIQTHETVNEDKRTNTYHVQCKNSGSVFYYKNKAPSSKQPSPRHTKYLNKKCQIGHHLPYKNEHSCFVASLAHGSPCQTVSTPCQQFERKADEFILPANTKCAKTCPGSHKRNNQSALKEKKVICSRCNQQIEQQFETPDLSSEIVTNSSDDDNYKACPCNAFGGRVRNAHICSEYTPTRHGCQVQEVSNTCRSDQESSVIVAQFPQGLSDDEWKVRQPIIHIRYRSRNAGSTPKCPISGDKASVISQQLKEQISGIIKKSQLLQQQAVQLRNECKHLEVQQWSSINQNRHDSISQCRFHKSNQVLAGQKDDQKPDTFADKNTNANPGSDQLIHVEDKPKHLEVQQRSSFSQNRHDSISQCRFHKGNQVLDCQKDDQKLGKFTGKNTNANSCSDQLVYGEDNPKQFKMIVKRALKAVSNGCLSLQEMPARRQNQRNSERKLNILDQKSIKEYTELVNKYCSDIDRDVITQLVINKNGNIEGNVHSSHREFIRQNLDHKRDLSSHRCFPWTEGDKNQNWNSRLLESKEGWTEKNNNRFQTYTSPQNERYFVNDPSEEAYQYVTDHFPTISRSPGLKEKKNVALGMHMLHCCCCEAVLKAVDFGEKDLWETQSGSACNMCGRVINLMTLAKTPCWGEQDLRVVKLYKDVQQSPRKQFENVDSGPGLEMSTQDYTNGAGTVRNACESTYLRRDICDAREYLFNSKGQDMLKQSLAQEGSLPFISSYKQETDAVSLLREDYWQWAYTIGSLTQTNLPITRAKYKTNEINHVNANYHRVLASQEDNECVFRRTTSPADDLSHVSPIRDSQKATRSVGTMVSFSNEQQSFEGRTTTSSVVSSIPTDNSSPSCSLYSSSVSLPGSTSSRTPEISVSESHIDSSVFSTRKRLVPDLHATNKKSSQLHLNPTSPFTANTPAPLSHTFKLLDRIIQPSESSLAESSNISLISVKIALNPITKDKIPNTKPLSKVSARTADTQMCQKGILTPCDEAKQFFKQNDKSPDKRSYAFRQGNRRELRKKRDKREPSTSINISSLEFESLLIKRHAPEEGIKYRVLPEIKHPRRRGNKHNDLDSQDSSHGIDDIPLDSVSIGSERERLGRKGHKTAELLLKGKPRTECKSSISIHNRVLFARPLPLLKQGKNRAVSREAKVKPISTNNVFSRCGSVVSVENVALNTANTLKPHPPAKVVSENLKQTTLEGEFKQFEVCMPCTEDNSEVPSTHEHCSEKQIVMWWNSPEFLKERGILRDLARYTSDTSVSFLPNVLEKPDPLISSKRFRSIPKSKFSVTKSRRVNVFDGGSLTVISQHENSSNDESQLDHSSEIISSQNGNPQRELPDSTPKKNDTNNQWRTSFVGCAEVIVANDDTVVIEGAYITRPASLEELNILLNSKYRISEVKGESSECRRRKVLPFRLTLSRNMAPSGSAYVNGTYSRQLLTSSDLFNWKFIADRLC